MELIDELISEIRKYDSKADIELIKKAYEYAKRAHKGQKRLSGDMYITHPVEVAIILTDLRADIPTLCAALLHDVAEESEYGLKDIKKEFGEEIASLVEGETKTSKVVFESAEDYTAENLRKILLATTKDVRVILVKLADRLHNMRTLKYFRREKQIRISRETLNIYAPIAHKLGMYSIKGELEDLSLRFLKPDIYQYLKKKINEKREVREGKAEKIMTYLRDKLKVDGVDFIEVSGRAKYFYSIYRKMIREKKTFEEIYDLIAVRVIVRQIPDCYKVIAAVHQMWKPVPGRFKDYIAVPKSNGYQSLHTDVATPYGVILEVQARTVDMHIVAKYGVAAHWRYKGTERDKAFDKRIAWLEQILDFKRKTANDFLDSLKVDLFLDEIVVFTPKGDPIILPERSTPVDFAFEVHTDVGIHTHKAEVNKQLVALDTPLKSGDVVRIITSNKTTPSRNWLSFAKTGKAKSKIRVILGIESDKPVDKSETSETVDITRYLKYSGKKGNLKLSKCCSPGFKEDIVAFRTKDGTITVHKSDCPNIYSLDANKKVEISWDLPDEYIKKIFVYVNDEYGLVEKILKKLSKEKINVLSINMRPHKRNIIITLQIRSENQETLDRTLKILEEMNFVNTVRAEEPKY